MKEINSYKRGKEGGKQIDRQREKLVGSYINRDEQAI